MSDGQPSARRPSAPAESPDDEAARDADGAFGEGDAVDSRSDWGELWQIPTIVLSLALIGLGLFIAVQRAPHDDFDGALRVVETMIAQGHLDTAGEQLRDVLEPNLKLADTVERARFHRAVADWLSLVQHREGVDRAENNQRIAAQYALAVELGLSLNAERLERWGQALVSLDRMDDARKRLAQLAAINPDEAGDAAEEIRDVYGRLFRRLVETAITRNSFEPDRLMSMLDEFRTDPRATLSDKAWAVAQLAELHLAHDQPQLAVDQLLVDLRRLESREEPGRVNIAVLYTQLGRGYYQLGRFEEAAFHLERALSMFEGDEPMRGDALVVLGRLAMARDDLEIAHERFDHVLRDFLETRSYLPALLGRAEVRGVLGDHQASLHDYADLVRLLAQRERVGTIRRVDVARSLIERHDAALTVGDLQLALQYIELAEMSFRRPEVPADILHRLASTSRQIADDLLAELDAGDDEGGRTRSATEGGRSDSSTSRGDRVSVRFEANRFYEKAGDYFVRHARALTVMPGEDQGWAASLWNGADCFDLAGLHERAIEHFEEYLAGRSRDDPRWADVNYRLGRAHHAILEHETAVRYYEQVIAEHPRSVVATRSHVPLARCFLALGRRPEAERQLREVLAGHHPVRPDALDYCDAVIELGVIYYGGGDFAAAVPVLDEARQRYPEDGRYPEILFQLGDSYRQLAADIAERIRPPSAESPGERRRLEAKRSEYLERAFELFTELASLDDVHDPRVADPARRDLVRSAALYRADCAYHLGNLARAIELYDQMARQYPDHPSSMHALVQIVNGYSELGDKERAAMAHRRAIVRLGQLRDEAFDAADVLMSRDAWERWLRHTPVVPEGTLTAAGESP